MYLNMWTSQFVIAYLILTTSWIWQRNEWKLDVQGILKKPQLYMLLQCFILVRQHIIEDTCTCTIVWFSLYIHVCWLICISLLGFTKGMVAKLECIFIFVSTFLVFILESGIKMIFFLNFMMFICFMLQWFGQRLYWILHVKVWRWRNWKIYVHRNVLWKLQMRKYSF